VARTKRRTRGKRIHAGISIFFSLNVYILPVFHPCRRPMASKVVSQFTIERTMPRPWRPLSCLPSQPSSFFTTLIKHAQNEFHFTHSSCETWVFSLLITIPYPHSSPLTQLNRFMHTFFCHMSSWERALETCVCVGWVTDEVTRHNNSPTKTGWQPQNSNQMKMSQTPRKKNFLTVNVKASFFSIWSSFFTVL